MLEGYFVLIITTATSIGAYLLFRRGRTGNSSELLAEALRGVFDCVGFAVVFYLVNAFVGIIVISLIRSSTSYFVRFYWLVEDPMIPIISALQGLFFRGYLHNGLNHDSGKRELKD
jgi:hypothetical protein